jgi:hypothetical protein
MLQNRGRLRAPRKARPTAGEALAIGHENPAHPCGWEQQPHRCTLVRLQSAASGGDDRSHRDRARGDPMARGCHCSGFANVSESSQVDVI